MAESGCLHHSDGGTGHFSPWMFFIFQNAEGFLCFVARRLEGHLIDQ